MNRPLLALNNEPALGNLLFAQVELPPVRPTDLPANPDNAIPTWVWLLLIPIALPIIYLLLRRGRKANVWQGVSPPVRQRFRDKISPDLSAVRQRRAAAERTRQQDDTHLLAPNNNDFTELSFEADVPPVDSIANGSPGTRPAVLEQDQEPPRTEPGESLPLNEQVNVALTDDRVRLESALQELASVRSTLRESLAKMSDFENTTAALANAHQKLQTMQDLAQQAESRSIEQAAQLRELQSLAEQLRSEKAGLAKRCQALEASAVDAAAALASRNDDLAGKPNTAHVEPVRAVDPLHQSGEHELREKLDQKRRKLALVKQKLREKLLLADSLTQSLSVAQQRVAELESSLGRSSDSLGDEGVVAFSDAEETPAPVQSLQLELEQLRDKALRLSQAEEKLSMARSRLAELEKRVLDDGNTRSLMEELREQNRCLSAELDESRALVHQLRATLANRTAQTR